MIPEFNDIGYLPPGVHLASLDDIATRFGQESEIRRAQMESVRWLVEMAKKAGVRRVIINGSFVTDVFEPNDVDCALLLSADFPLDPTAAADLNEGLPFVDLHMAEAKEFAIIVDSFTHRIAIQSPKASSRWYYEHSKQAAVGKYAGQAQGTRRSLAGVGR